MAHVAHAHDTAHDDVNSDEAGLPHITPLKIYFGVWAALTFLTAVTVWVSYFDFGSFNLVVALTVAVIKASLVCLFFMHLKYDNKLNAVVFLSSLVFLSIFFFLTFGDMFFRGKVDPYQGTFVKPHGVQQGPVTTHAPAAEHH